MPRRSSHRNLVQSSFHPNSTELSRKVIHGASFTVLGVLIRTVITFGSMSVLARLLSPADFGLIAMATVITELAALFSNFGFGSILIQAPRTTRLQLDTIFWSALTLGFILALTVFSASFLADSVFKEEKVSDLLRFVCISFIFEQLSVVPRSILSRTLQFRKEFAVQIGMLLCRAGTAISMAWLDFGVWSLAGAGVAAAFAQMCFYTLLVGYRPRLRFSKTYLASTWRTNSGYFGNGILFYINYNIDLFLVGRMLGSTPLGIYQNARSLTDEIRSRIAIPLQQVLFPAFSILQNEKVRFQSGIMRSGRLLALVVVPIGFGIAAVSEELVALLYGDQWLAMIPLLKIISIGAGIRATTAISNPIFNATNRVGLSFRLFFIGTAIFVLSMLTGSMWGLFGVAFALLFSTVVALVFFRIALGLVELRTTQMWKMLGIPTLSSVIMFIVVITIREPVYQLTSFLPWRLLSLVLVGVLAYIVAVLVMARGYLRELRDVITTMRKRRVA